MVNAAEAMSAPFSGTAEANSTVKVSVSDAGNAHNLVGSTTADGSGIWTIGSLDLSGLADGPITVSATTTDAVGNTGPAGAQSGSKDTVAPAAPPVDVFSAVNAAGAASVSFSGTAEPNSTVNVAVSDVGKLHTVTGPAPADGSGNWTVSGLDLSGLADGAITVSEGGLDGDGRAAVDLPCGAHLAFGKSRVRGPDRYAGVDMCGCGEAHDPTPTSQSRRISIASSIETGRLLSVHVTRPSAFSRS